MSKAVIISIRPKWCELIASGKKTVEVRKTKPSAILPWKCYIYQTLPKSGDWNERDGHVIGEFVCHNITRFDVPFPAYWDQVDKATLDAACLKYGEAHNYLGHRTGWAWHISDVVIYDKPKKLGEFLSWNTGVVFKDGYPMPTHEIKRPPQSWCYVEELT